MGAIYKTTYVHGIGPGMSEHRTLYAEYIQDVITFYDQDGTEIIGFIDDPGNILDAMIGIYTGEVRESESRHEELSNEEYPIVRDLIQKQYNYRLVEARIGAEQMKKLGIAIGNMELSKDQLTQLGNVLSEIGLKSMDIR